MPSRISRAAPEPRDHQVQAIAVARLARPASRDAPPDRFRPAQLIESRPVPACSGPPRESGRAALATRASSMARTRMTSTPSRTIVTSDAKNAGPNARRLGFEPA